MAFPSLKKPPQIVDTMPIATPQGTLDFKSVDTVTFVGASSNTVIDTTTGSLGVGVDGNGPTSNLHVVGNTRLEGDINMLHTSNTASIKLNSNVVTEFPRSKKLIKYPRVALTSASQDGYVVTSYEGTTSGAENYNVFNGLKTGTDRWSPTASAYTSGSWNSTQSNGTTQDVNGNTWTGEWLQIQLPNKIALKRHIIQTRSSHTHRMVKKGVILGSNTNGTTWNLVDSWSGLNSGSEREVSIGSINYYDYYRLVSIELETGVGDAVRTDIQEWELFGVPEYDPEAHGTDVTVKSVPNVPNTDWLEVYYDGQDYSTMPATVDNKTGVSAYDATPINGVGFDATYKAFTFNKTANQYLSTSTPMSGNYVHSFSAWFKPNSLGPGGSGNVGGDALFYVGGVTGSSDYKVELFMETDRINYTFGGNNFQAYPTIVNGKWYHIVVTYNGLGGQNGREIYLNNVKLNATHSGSTGTLNLPSSNLDIGRYTPDGSATTSAFDGSIANFRLFNRVITPDEIYQLYAYQKEYFGHGDLSMTLKAGRLGIGTSEPRAALDVRGDIYAPGTIVQVEQSLKTDTFSTTGASNHPLSPGNDVTGLAVTIHPKFANSRILVSYTVSTGAYGRAYLRIQRKQGGSTTTIAPTVGPEANTQNQGKCTTSHSGSGDSSVNSQSFEYYDTIGGTEPITYQIQAWTYHSTYYIYVNRGHDDGNGSNNGTYWARTLSSITAKEVCQ